MTAPIVWTGARTPLTEAHLTVLGPVYGSARLRSSRRRWALGERLARIDHWRGDLWEREAERDVQAHGEPRSRFHDWPKHVERRNPPILGYGPGKARRYLADNIERRRPAMRATRAGLAAVSNEGGQ